jgi:hypothetical protein
LHPGEIDRAIRLNIDRGTLEGKRDKQLFEFISLQERFSPCNADIGRIQAPGMFKNGIDTHLNSTILRVRRIAPAAVKIAACEADEQTGFSLVYPFTLQAPENFSDFHSVSSAQAVGDSQTRIFGIVALIPSFLQTE